MKTILMSTAAAALLFAVPATAQQAAPAPTTDAAPAVPETAIGVQERRNLVTNEDSAGAPASMMIGEESRSWYIDCTDPAVVCENYEGLATGSVGTQAAPAPDTNAPAAPDSSIGVQERRSLVTDEDNVEPGAGSVPQ